MAKKKTIAMKKRRSAGGVRSAAAGEKTKTRSEELLHRLEGEILSGAIPPGTKLDEKSLASRFSVSRTPVREVLWHLASSNLVQMRPRQGAVVRQFTLAEFVEMFQVMAELEGLCARLAAERATPEEKALLRTHNAACAAAVKINDETAFFDANSAFHGAVSLASRNSFLIAQQRDLRRLVNPYRRFLTRQPGRMKKSVVEHDEVIVAIERGDAQKAGDLMRAHVNMLGEQAGDFISVLSGLEQAGLSLSLPAGSLPLRDLDRPHAAAKKIS